MKYEKAMVSLVAILALAVLSIASVSAFGDFTGVEVKGIDVLHSSTPLATFAGETLPVRVIFHAYDNASDVRIKTWISGEKEYAVSTERFDVIEGNDYSRLVSVTVPSKVDPSEDLKLEVVIESRNGGVSDSAEISLTAQRTSYDVEILEVVMNSEVKAGENLALNIVLKNAGRKLAEDTFVKARIPALGVESKAYFGDMSAVDQSNPDKEDAAERRMFLNIPANAPAGVYLVEFEAYNADSNTIATKKVSVISSASDSSVFVSSANSKRFAVGEKGEYTLTLVNSGDKIRVYELVADAPTGLTVEMSESTVIVPAGSSKTVTLDAVASKEGKSNFAVDVYSDGALVKRFNYLADIAGTKSSNGFAGNTTIVLTVVLAIIFVVLLVVLIVLLTRKPEKTEEFGESYY
jgi:hypothetical protein